MLALSIRQPYVEQILRGTKRVEYRSRRTGIIGETFYLYAAKLPGDRAGFDSLGRRPGELPTGLILRQAQDRHGPHREVCRGRRRGVRVAPAGRETADPAEEAAASAAAGVVLAVLRDVVTIRRGGSRYRDAASCLDQIPVRCVLFD